MKYRIVYYYDGTLQGANQKITTETVRPQPGKRALVRPNVAWGVLGGWGGL